MRAWLAIAPSMTSALCSFGSDFVQCKHWWKIEKKILTFSSRGLHLQGYFCGVTDIYCLSRTIKCLPKTKICDSNGNLNKLYCLVFIILYHILYLDATKYQKPEAPFTVTPIKICSMQLSKIKTEILSRVTESDGFQNTGRV